MGLVLWYSPGPFMNSPHFGNSHLGKLSQVELFMQHSILGFVARSPAEYNYNSFRAPSQIRACQSRELFMDTTWTPNVCQTIAIYVLVGGCGPLFYLRLGGVQVGEMF